MRNKKLKRIILNFTLSFCVLTFVFCIFSKADGAVLYLEPPQGEYQSGDTFLVDIKIDPEGECLNAVETGIIFPQDILKFVDFSKGKSILSLWAKEPNDSGGFVDFSGGIPGGFCGRIPGDPGPSNILGQIVFQIPSLSISQEKENVFEIKFSENSQVLLNDGLGTPAKLTTQGAIFKILPKIEPSKDEWREKLAQDDIPPEVFEIQALQDPTIFEGKYFIIFHTVDKQTGLDCYEVKEGDREWTKAESPYPIKDQSLKNIIKVKAVDKAGNERIAEYKPQKISFFSQVVYYLKFIWNWLLKIIH